MVNIFKKSLLPLAAAVNLSTENLPAQEPLRIADPAPAVAPAIAAIRMEFASSVRGFDVAHVRFAERLTTNGKSRDVLFSSSPAVKIAILVERKTGQVSTGDEVSLYAQNPQGQWQPVLMSFKVPAGAPAAVGEADLSITNGVFCLRMPASFQLTGLRTLSIERTRACIDPNSLGFPAQALIPTITTSISAGNPKIIPLQISPAAKLYNGIPPTTSGSNIRVESSISNSTTSGPGANIGGISVNGVQIK